MLILTRIIDNILENLNNDLIRCFYLAIALWMVNTRISMVDVVLLIELVYIFVLKFTTMVGNNSQGDSILIYDVV